MEHGPLGKRLDCWKEVASHLGKGERTVKRWEVERGLPIHRIPGAGRATIYAYTAELDEWLQSRNVQEIEPVQEAPDAVVPLVRSESSVVPQHAPAPGEESTPLPAAPMAWPGLRWNGTAALAGLVLVGLAGAGVRLAALHHREMSAGTSFLTAKSHSPTVPAAASAVSDSDVRQAHELYLKGRYEWNQRTPESLNRALDDFTQAVVHDPGDAKSYAGLADTYNLLQIYSTLPLPDSYPRAMAAAKRAVQLDDSLAEAHRALAFADFYGAADYAEAEKEFRRAIQLNPNDPVTRRWYGNAFAMPGRYEESFAQFDKAQELDPASHSTLSDEGVVLFDAGRAKEGIALLTNVERTDPEFFSAHNYLSGIALSRRDFRTFLEEGQRAAETRDDPVQRDVIAFARAGYETGGPRGLLENLYTKQKAYYTAGQYPPGWFARTCVLTGKRQEALHLLDVASSDHRPDALWIFTDPILRTLKDEPGYQELVKKINFPPAPGQALARPVAAAELQQTPPIRMRDNAGSGHTLGTDGPH